LRRCGGWIATSETNKKGSKSWPTAKKAVVEKVGGGPAVDGETRTRAGARAAVREKDKAAVKEKGKAEKVN